MADPLVKKTNRNQLPPGPGRPKGVPNKTTTLLKDAILQAAEAAGGKEGIAGYLTTQAKEQPSAFMGLLGKVLPMNMEHNVGDQLADLIREVNGRSRGLPNAG